MRVLKPSFGIPLLHVLHFGLSGFGILSHGLLFLNTSCCLFTVFKKYSASHRSALSCSGPAPDVDFVLSICLQSNPVPEQASKHLTTVTQLPAGAASSKNEPSGSYISRPIPSGSSSRMTRDRQSGKRKDSESKYNHYDCFNFIVL